MTDRRLVLATHNEHKVVELRAILAPVLAETGRELVAATDLGVPDVPETEVTFAGNALLKARAVAAHTGLPALADDSGLAVDVLGGCPGVFSARWSGGPGRPRDEKDRDNVRLLLEQLADVPDEHRGAAFVCCAALVIPAGGETTREGRMPGRITRTRCGTGGFGYDPVFAVEGDPGGRTLAQFAPQEKNAVSHRARAFAAIAGPVRDALG